jgi:hypothetical protein
MKMIGGGGAAIENLNTEAITGVFNEGLLRFQILSPCIAIACQTTSDSPYTFTRDNDCLYMIVPTHC